LQLYADGGYQLRIRRLEGTPNYGPRHIVSVIINYQNSNKGLYLSPPKVRVFFLKAGKGCYSNKTN
jgi:hypothetical protein